MLKAFLFLLGALLLLACDKKTTTETGTNEVISDSLSKNNKEIVTEKVVKQESGTDFTKHYEEKEFTESSTDSVTTLMMRSSSTIKVRKNTFVYADNNKPVTEPVIIKYREIKQATDAIGSSISMIYDSAGIKQNFESAGMFEFYACTKSSGRIVKIAKGKSVEINYKTDVQETDYNFYKYDSLKQNWTYLSRAFNSSKVTKHPSTTILDEPIKPNKPSNNGSAIDLDIDVDKFPELNVYSGIVWEYAAESKAANPLANKWIFSENWDDVKLETYTQSKGCYKITLSSKNKKFSTVIKPALTGNDYSIAMEKYQKAMSKYNVTKSKKSNTMTLKINDFGIYNIDRIASIKNKYTIEADFVLDNNEDVSDKTVYLIYNQNRNVISYTKSGLNTWQKFTFDALASDNHLLMILPNNKIALGNTNDFEIIKKQGHKSYRFILKKSEKTIDNISELNNIFDK